MTNTVKPYIECSKGDACTFTVDIGQTIDAKYVTAKFVVRESFDVTKPELLSITQATGITINYTDTSILVTISAELTKTLPSFVAAKPVAAQLRLYAADINDRMSMIIPFILVPGVITDV